MTLRVVLSAGGGVKAQDPSEASLSDTYFVRKILLDKSGSKMIRRSRGWGLNHLERKILILETATRWNKRATRSSMHFQGYPRFENASHVLRSTGNVLRSSGQSENIYLPPISGGKVTTAFPLHLKEPRGCFLPAGNKTKENTEFYVFGTQCGRTKQEFNTCNKIKVVHNKKETCSRWIKGTEDQPEPTEPQVHQKRDGDGAKPCEERQQRAFCSDDSAETESEESGDGGGPGGTKEDSDDDEYYSNKRIAEWVLKVNSSLFSTSSSSKSAEEQDMATMIYSGD